MAPEEEYSSFHLLNAITLPGSMSSFARSMQVLRDRSESVEDVITQSGDKWSLPSQQNEIMIFCQHET